jgi:hypothetical protein
MSPVGATPFAVTAPPELTLAADRTGRTSFTVTNVTGRPVRARLVPKGQGGAQDGWLAVVGPAEVPMNVGSTVTTTIAVTVPPEVAEGKHTLLLEVVAEDDTESVTGQSVAFTVPPAIVQAKKKFPWKLLIIIAVVVVLIGGGAAVFALTRGSSAPSNVTPPSVVGTPVIGAALSVEVGQWEGDSVSFTQQWFRCEADVDQCAEIAGALEPTYTPTNTDFGQRLRVRVTGTDDNGSSAADSAIVGPVAVQPGSPIVPNLRDLPITQARAATATLGLTVTTVVSRRSQPSCPQRVVDQSLDAGSPATPGESLSLTITPPVPFIRCRQ